jgi:hypothetical protein
MNPPQALQYIKEIMAEYRTEDYRAKVGEFYPFEEDALEYIIQNLEKRPPVQSTNVAETSLQPLFSQTRRGAFSGERLRLIWSLLKPCLVRRSIRNWNSKTEGPK